MVVGRVRTRPVPGGGSERQRPIRGGWLSARSPQRDETELIAALAQRLAALSRAGVDTQACWRALARQPDELAPIATTVTMTLALGGSVSEGLLSARSGLATRSLAVACQISTSVGAPLAGVLETLADALYEAQQDRRNREVALAGPRAGITVLTWLPAAGLALGALTGVNTVAILLNTHPGRISLAVGLGLWLLGHYWVRRLLARAERAGR